MEITTSPPFTGGAFLTPICGPDGTAALPTYSFCSDSDTGIYLSTLGEISLSTGGNQRFVVNSSGVETKGALLLPNGNRIFNDANYLAFTANGNGNLEMRLRNDNLIGANNTNLRLDNASGSVSIFGSNGDTGTAITSTGAGTKVSLAPNNSEALTAVDGEIGIGTTSPSTKLDVLSGAGDVATLRTGSVVGTFGITHTGNGVVYLDATTVASVASDIVFQANSVENMRVVGSSGNVGIGTSTPNAKLDIVGGTVDSVSNPAIRLENRKIIVWEDNLSGDSKAGFIWYTNANQLNFGTNNGTKLSIQEDGNVGIGTGSPDGKLHVQSASAGAVTPHTTADELVVENSASGGISVLVPNSGTANVAFGSPANNYASLIQWDYTNSAFNIASNDVGAELVLRSSNFVEAMRIDSSQNVGIGTSSPNASAILDLSSTTKGFSPPAMTTTQRDLISTPATGLQIFNTTTSSTQEYTGAIWQNIGASGTADPLLLGSGTAANPTYSFSADSNTGIYWLGVDQLAISTGGSTALVVDNSQNVGIGTGSPDGRLHVHSATAGAVSAPASANNLVIEDSGDMGVTLLCPDANISTIVFGTVTDNLGADINWDYTNSLYSIRTAKAGASMRFATANGTEAMRIDSSQNVGIGITTPDGTLHVHTATAGSVTAAAGADDLVVENNTTGGISILTPDAAQGSLIFGSPTSNQGAAVNFLYSSGVMEVGTNKAGGTLSIKTGAFAEAVNIDSTQHVDIKDSLSVNTPTGGDKGAGSINAKAIYDDGKQIFANAPSVSDYVGGQAVYIQDGLSSSTTYSISAQTNSTWIDIGPTGSGATNIWTALDDLPTTAKAIIVRISNGISGSTNATLYDHIIYARAGGSTVGQVLSARVNEVEFTNRSGSAETARSLSEVHIPLDSNLIFDFLRSESGASISKATNAVLVGWVDDLV